MRYQSFVTPGVRERLQRGALAAVVATAMTNPAMAFAISCVSTGAGGITTENPSFLPPFTSGGGSLTVMGPTFVKDPLGCPGFLTTGSNTTPFTITYTAVLLDALTSDFNFDIIVESAQVLDFAGTPLVEFEASANGNATYPTSGFVVKSIKVSTSTGIPTPPLQNLTATAETDSVPGDGSPFDTGPPQFTKPFFLQPVETPELMQLLDINLTQRRGTDDTFSITFPGSLDSVIVPVVPEPGSLGLIASALGGFAVIVRRNRHARCSGRAQLYSG